MSSETGDPRPARLSTMATRPQEPEHFPCPRCDSTNTKFCYYNNYNLSQPRHFCKSCRRYWTRGGTLRNVPVGGGSRKSSSSSSSKRPRTTSPNATTPPTDSSPSDYITHQQQPLEGYPASMVPQMGSGSVYMTGPLMGCEVNLNETFPEASSFSSLLTTQGLLPFGSGFGLGLQPGLHGLEFGLEAMDWPMDTGGGGGDGDGASNGSAGGSSSTSGCNDTWPKGGGVDGALGDGDSFGWPDLAISMPGKGLK